MGKKVVDRDREARAMVNKMRSCFEMVADRAENHVDGEKLSFDSFVSSFDVSEKSWSEFFERLLKEERRRRRHRRRRHNRRTPGSGMVLPAWQQHLLESPFMDFGDTFSISTGTDREGVSLSFSTVPMESQNVRTERSSNSEASGNSDSRGRWAHRRSVTTHTDSDSRTDRGRGTTNSDVVATENAGPAAAATAVSRVPQAGASAASEAGEAYAAAQLENRRRRPTPRAPGLHSLLGSLLNSGSFPMFFGVRPNNLDDEDEPDLPAILLAASGVSPDSTPSATASQSGQNGSSGDAGASSGQGQDPVDAERVAHR